MPVSDFGRSVFINCPFDEDYQPLLQAIAFTGLFLGFTPRLANERSDSGEVRIEKIKELIEASRFSIHDLSRCQADSVGEIYRLNMPFELGLDFGCRQYAGGLYADKCMLVLEEEPYRYQAAISDIAGFDIEHHKRNGETATRKVRNWLAPHCEGSVAAPAMIYGDFIVFLEWNYRRLLAEGFSDIDIQEYPTAELVNAIRLWLSSRRSLDDLN